MNPAEMVVAGGGEARLSLWNRQRGVKLNVAWLKELTAMALTFCLGEKGEGAAVLGSLDEVEITLVSDPVIARVHRQFMGIPGATDVITFDHGEIVVSAATAAREGAERGEATERETFRYIVHGLLHLNGHEDASVAEAKAMWEAQERIVAKVWPT